MRSSFKRLLTAALLTCALVSPTFNLRAQDGQPATRPRRATSTQEWPTTSTSAPAIPEIEPEVVRLTSEPSIRIGLATGARSVTVSTDGSALKAADVAEQPVPLELARVRVEARSYPALPAPTPVEPSGVQAASTPSNRDATTGGVRLTSRASAPERGEALYAPGSAKPVLDLRAPVVFAPEDPELYSVRYNEKSYRGRIEVFANSKGTLTVVNVVPLEEYVRGVVPNELSPGGWPELEALKAQAVAARTYAVSNLGRYAAEGYDLTPDTRSQVYGGRSTEHPLTDRAVSETRGRILTYKGAPINALYTSTCGGRTENGENIFGGAPVAYLRGRECALEAGDHFAALELRTSRDPASVKLAEHQTSARDAALLAVHGFELPARLNDDWLASNVTAEEARAMLNRVASLARQPAPIFGTDATRPAGFATALAAALDGESRGATLLNSADVEYLLAFRDADEVPQQNRADVAAMLREGHLSLLPDGTLRPRQTLTRARTLRAVAHALEGRGLLRLQKAGARIGVNNSFVLRPASGKDLSVTAAADAYLFRAFGEALFPVREVRLVGGEPVVYHTNARGEVDYLEVRPAESGAASDHLSRFANWAESLTPSGVLSRLSRSIPEVGTLLDLRVRSRGVSGRVLDLEVVGTAGTAHVRGGRIRSALGLREQLFVIDRTFDENGRVLKFTFTGRGWGHGVGMCQVGAYGLARAGMSYDKILKHFYTGVSVTKLY
ncbi:MAG: SpoIID/LytB domain-containing protein [Acidobacteria bacterium]|nr:SpoIID/LytB domain-containing protein [Acidobacteriota bacterium]